MLLGVTIYVVVAALELFQWGRQRQVHLELAALVHLPSLPLQLFFCLLFGDQVHFVRYYV